VRYAGIINMLIIGGALLHGQVRPELDRRLISAVLVVAVTMGSFFAVRAAVNYFAPRTVAYDATAQIDPSAIVNDQQMVGTISEAPTLVTGTSGRSGYGTRIVGYGTWFSYLLWQPLRLGTGSRLVFYIATIFGWIVALIGVAAVIEAIRAQRWLIPATALYTAALCLNWPHATARYLVPITPIILFIIVRGLQILEASPKQRAIWRTVGAIGLGSVVLCNLALFIEEVRIMRSSHFADHYEAGLNKGLVAAAQYLSSKNVGNWQTAVNPEYINIGKRRMSPTGLRILTMLTGKAALQVPKKWTESKYKLPNDREFRVQFLKKHKVAFYLEQPKISPWRVSHYRMAWLQKWLTGLPVDQIESGWRLYRCDGSSTPIQVPLPSDVEFPTRVPGM
jgi:hypothetical protein